MTVPAWEIPRGIMKKSANTVMEIPWAANSTSPIHPIKIEANENIPLSAIIVKHIGQPSLKRFLKISGSKTKKSLKKINKYVSLQIFYKMKDDYPKKIESTLRQIL